MLTTERTLVSKTTLTAALTKRLVSVGIASVMLSDLAKQAGDLLDRFPVLLISINHWDLGLKIPERPFNSTGFEWPPFTHTSHTPYLRSDVVWCSTEGLGGDSVVHIFFTHAKICNLNVTLTVQHHVVQLQVSTGGRHSVKGEQHPIHHAMRNRRACHLKVCFYNLKF